MAADAPPRDERQERAAVLARLATMDRPALESLAAHLLQTYVVEGLAPAAAAGAGPYDLVGEETFAGMLRRLKTERPNDAVLQRFVVNGEHVQVRTHLGNVDLTEYQRPTTPGAPGTQPAAAAPPAVPTPRDSIYNRDLYKQAGDSKSAPAPAKSSPAPAPAAKSAGPAPAATAPKPAGPGGSDAKDAKAGRSRMIELD